MFFYWKGILEVSDEVYAECQHTFEKIQNQAYQGIQLKQLKGYKLWSARTGFGRERGRCRLLFTVIEWGGDNYLQFVERTDKHYKDSKFMRNRNALARFREKARTRLASGAASSSVDDSERNDWEDVVSGERFGTLKRHKAYQPVPMQWYADRPMVLDDAQQSASSLQLPVLFTGLPGSGKTSTILLQLPNLRIPYSRIVCITRSAMLRNDLQAAWNAMPEAIEPGGEVEFLTYREWAKSCDQDMIDKTEAGEDEFIDWYLAHAASIMKRLGYKTLPTLLEKPAGRDRRFTERYRRDEARAVYQEGRIASGCMNKAAYLSLGKRLSILEPDSRERGFVWDIVMQGWLPALDASRRIDLSFVRLNPPVCGGLVWLDEAQDVSGAQLENIAKFAGPDLQLVLCAGDFQRLNDALPFTKPIRNLSYSNGRNGKVNVTHIPLPGSYRVPLVLEAFMQRIMTLAINDLGGLQDKRQVHQFKCSQGRHARPGKAHWLTWEAMEDSLRDDLKALASDNPQCVIITHEEYLQEAEARFGEGAMVRTVTEVKGMQFETCILYRYLDTARFAGVSERMSSHQSTASSSTAVHRPKQGLGKWENATAFNRLFTACSRVSDTLVLVDTNRPCYPTDALATALKQTLPEGVEPEFSRQRRVFSAEDWQVCVEQYIRNENIRLARAIFMRRCHGTNEAFDALLERCQARVMPVLPPAAPVVADIPQADVVVPVADSASSRATDTGLSFFRQAPRAATSLAITGNSQNAPAGADARQRARAIFSPGNFAKMHAFVNNPGSIDEFRSYLRTPLNVLPFITAEQFGMQFSTEPQKQYGSSLLYWFFKLGDRRHHDFLFEIFTCNPRLLTELRQLFKKMTLHYEPSYNPGFADLCHAVHNHGIPLEESRVLKLLMHKSGIETPDEFLWAAARHLPHECHSHFKKMLMYPAFEWEALSSRLRETHSFWFDSLMVNFLKKYFEALKKADSHYDKDYKKRVIEAFQTNCFGEREPGLKSLHLKLTQTLKNRRIRNAPDMVDILGVMLRDKAATPLNTGYIFLAAIRDSIAHPNTTQDLTVNSSRAPEKSRYRTDKVEFIFDDAAMFWQYADLYSKTGASLLHKMMSDKSGAEAILDAFNELPELTTKMKLMPLLKDQAPTQTHGVSSLLAWLCEGSESAHAIVHDLLVTKNPLLSTLVCRALQDCVFKRTFKAEISDLVRLTQLEKTNTGLDVLNELAKKLQCSPAFLILKLHEYLPDPLIPEIRNAWEYYLADWERYFNSEKFMARGGVLLQQMLIRIKERFQQVESFAAKKWTAAGYNDYRPLRERVCFDLEILKDDFLHSEKNMIDSVIARLATLHFFSLPDVYRIFREAIRDHNISPFSYLAGYMRDFCVRFEKDVQHLETLLDGDAKDFRSNFEKIEWSCHEAKVFATSDALLIEKAKSEAEEILQKSISEGFLDAAMLAQNPKALYVDLFQKVMDSLPADSIDHSHTQRFIQALNRQEDFKPIIELFQDVYGIFPENSYPKTGLFAEVLRAVCLHAEAVMEASYMNPSMAASSMR